MRIDWPKFWGLTAYWAMVLGAGLWLAALSR